MGGKLFVLGIAQEIKEVELWEIAGRYGTIWDTHIHRKDGKTRGTASIIFDIWAEANNFRKEWDGRMMYGRRWTVRWDREVTGMQGESGKQGEYPMEMTKGERRTIVVGGVEEGGVEEEENEIFVQDILMREAMESKNLRSWNQVRWKVESIRRLGRKTDERPRLLSVRFLTLEGADKVYHSRKTEREKKVWVRRYVGRKMKEMEDMLKNIRRKRWELKQNGIGWETSKNSSKVKRHVPDNMKPQIKMRDMNHVEPMTRLGTPKSAHRTPLDTPKSGTPTGKEYHRRNPTPPNPRRWEDVSGSRQQGQQVQQELRSKQQEQQNKGEKVRQIQRKTQEKKDESYQRPMDRNWSEQSKYNQNQQGQQVKNKEQHQQLCQQTGSLGGVEPPAPPCDPPKNQQQWLIAQQQERKNYIQPHQQGNMSTRQQTVYLSHGYPNLMTQYPVEQRQDMRNYQCDMNMQNQLMQQQAPTQNYWSDNAQGNHHPIDVQKKLNDLTEEYNYYTNVRNQGNFQ